MNADDDTKETMLALVQPDSTPTGLAVAGVVDVDHEMVVRARRGDQAAFASLLRKPDVEDAVQQTFLEAWRCLGRFEGKSRFTTWLTRIAIYTCFSFRRRLRRLLLVDDAALEGQGLSVVGGALGDGSAARVGDPRSEAAPLAADEVASRRARSLALDEVLQELSEKKRVVFVLSDLEDFTSPEVAEILSIPETTVRTRLFYARKELAALLRNHKGFVDLIGLNGAVAP